MIPIIGFIGSLPIYVFGTLLSLAVLAFLIRFNRSPQSKFNLVLSLLVFVSIFSLGSHLAGDGFYGPLTQSWLGMSFMTGTSPTAPGLKAYPVAMWISVFSALVLAVLVKRYDNR